MPADHILQIINPQPGIQKDGTQYDSNTCVDGQWCRFDVGGKPKKIGGYRLIDVGDTTIVRGMFEVSRQNSVDVYLGRSSSLNRVNILNSGITSPEIDRTPVGFEKSLLTVTLANNPLATVNLSAVVTVTVPSTANLRTGNVVTIAGAAATNNITAPQLNISATITVIDATHFSYTSNGVANATGAGGGAVVTYSISLDDNLWTFDLYTIPSTILTHGNDPLTSTMGSGVVIVTVTTTSGLQDNNIVTVAGATAFDSLTAPQLNISASITILSATTFSFTTAGVALAGAAGGGNAVIVTVDLPTTYIIAHAAPNANDINNNIETFIWWGDISLTSPLTAIAAPNQSCSGGIVVGYPYFFKYGSDGVIGYTTNPTDWSAAVFASIGTGTKIVKGLRTRGGGQSPSFLFWSIDSVIRANFVGGATVFDIGIIQDKTYIMAQNSIVSFENMFFWIATDQFYTYTGIVKPLKNDMNTNYFFDNVNLNARNKIWGMALPRFHEIWWFWPKGEATECSDVLIYNYKYDTWYDSVLSRTAGYPPGIYHSPLMADGNAILNRNTGIGLNYGIWQHEFGTDMTLFGQNLAIDSFFDTNFISFFDNNPAEDRQMRTRRIEPDFVQEGEMTIQVMSRDFAQGPVTISDPYPFSPDTGVVTLSKVDMINMGRIVNFRFRSNIAGGAYQAGKILLNYAPGDYYP